MSINVSSLSSTLEPGHTQRADTFQTPNRGQRDTHTKSKFRVFYYAAMAGLVLLFLCSCVLWIRSYRANDFVFYGAARPAPRVCEQWGVVSNRGICRIGWQQGDLVVTTGWNYTRGQTFPWADRSTFWKRAGFNYEAKNNFQFMGKHCDYRIVAFPYWIITALCALTIAIPNRKSPRAQRLFGWLASF
jgi:hypothetical protein